MLDDMVVRLEVELETSVSDALAVSLPAPAPLLVGSADEFCEEHGLDSSFSRKALQKHFDLHKKASETAGGARLGFLAYNYAITVPMVQGAVHKPIADALSQITGVSNKTARIMNSSYGLIKNGFLLVSSGEAFSRAGYDGSIADRLSQAYFSGIGIGVCTSYDIARSFVIKKHLPSLSTTAALVLAADGSRRLWRTLPARVREPVTDFVDYLQGRPHDDIPYQQALQDLGSSLIESYESTGVHERYVLPAIGATSLLKDHGRTWL